MSGYLPPGVTQNEIDAHLDGSAYGYEPPELPQPAPCPVCGGDGGHETWGPFCSRAGDILRGWQTCTFCGGDGEVECELRELEDLEPLVPA